MSMEEKAAVSPLPIEHRTVPEQEHVCPRGLGKTCPYWTARGCAQKHENCRTATTKTVLEV